MLNYYHNHFVSFLIILYTSNWKSPWPSNSHDIVSKSKNSTHSSAMDITLTTRNYLLVLLLLLSRDSVKSIIVTLMPWLLTL